MKRRTTALAAALSLLPLGQPLLLGSSTALATAAVLLSTRASHSQSADDYLNRGNAKSELKDYQGAIADYNKAIQIDPKDAAAYYNRGGVKDELKDYQGAIADYNKAIQINPLYATAYSNRGNAKSRLRDYQGAIADFNKAIEIDPKDGTALGNRGIVKYAQKGMQGVCVDCCSDWKKALSLGNEKTVGMFSDPRLDLDWCLNMR